jgi:integrative and conjugative element protein (TIGR02256 family)
VRRPRRLTPTLVWVSGEALSAMAAEADDRLPHETGGMLLGYCSPHTNPEELVIETVIGPGPGALHTATTFTPDSEWQHQQLAAAYHASGRITTYLGDWHSHPGGQPTPSRRDLRTAWAIARRRAARMRQPLMVILGADEDHTWQVAVFRFSRGRLHPVPVRQLDR